MTCPEHEMYLNDNKAYCINCQELVEPYERVQRVWDTILGVRVEYDMRTLECPRCGRWVSRKDADKEAFATSRQAYCVKMGRLTKAEIAAFMDKYDLSYYDVSRLFKKNCDEVHLFVLGLLMPTEKMTETVRKLMANEEAANQVFSSQNPRKTYKKLMKRKPT